MLITKQDVRAVAMTLLAQETFDHGAATLDLRTGGGAPKTGFLVSRRDMERVIPGAEVPDAYTLSVRLGHYVDERPPFVRFVTVYRDPSSGTVYFDSPSHCETLPSAVRTAEYNVRPGFWDCLRSEYVPVASVTGRAA